MNLTRRTASALVAAGLMLGLSGLVAPSAVASSAAAAASTCFGTKIDQIPLKHGSSSKGFAQLWYSSASGGTNCVIVYDNLAGSHVIGAFIDRGLSGGWDKSDVDNYTTYAGPISLTNMSRTCVSWGGNMYVGSDYYSAFRFNVHCG